MRSLISLPTLVLVLFSASFSTHAQDPVFDGITRSTIMNQTLSSDPINGNDDATNRIPTGTIVVYRTKEGRFGKFKVLRYGYVLWLRIVTYADDGSVHASADSTSINGTWLCDLDSAKQAHATAPGDFKWDQMTDTLRTVEPRGGAQFAVYATGTGAERSPEPAPTALVLCQNSPNPFALVTRISFRVEDARYVRLEVFDCLGRVVSVLLDRREEPGAHDVQFDASGLPSGTYLYRLYDGSGLQMKRMLIIR